MGVKCFLPSTISVAAISSQAITRALRLLEGRTTIGLSRLPSKVCHLLSSPLSLRREKLWLLDKINSCYCLLRRCSYYKNDKSVGEVGLVVSRPIVADVIETAKTLETSVTYQVRASQHTTTNH